MFLTCASVPLPEMTTCCMCQKEIHLLVSAVMSAAGVSSTVRVSKGFSVSVVFLHFIITDPQNEAKVTSDPLAAHTDWLTLNIGGRLFTTTRYLCFKFSFRAVPHSLFLCLLNASSFIIRSTLVSKEPESMLAHMFREKGTETS